MFCLSCSRLENPQLEAARTLRVNPTLGLTQPSQVLSLAGEFACLAVGLEEPSR